MSHTPTPWVHDRQSDCILDNGGNVIVSPYESEHNIDNDTANAAFIVKAVNAHDDLVAALKALTGHKAYYEGMMFSERAKMARDALAKAGAL